ncbi:MAG TPA: spore gernimation protein, partial [Peptococcaceae bacterium]|nr:spore gernimation protein [Peptococcaceae bacterium]
MSEQGKIDSKQAVMLMLSMVLPTAILTVPPVVVEFARQDAWLS